MRKQLSRILDRVSPLQQLEPERTLRRLGLEPRRSLGQRWLPPVGGFALGFSLGIGVGFVTAPKAGREVRAEIRELVVGWSQAGETGSTPEEETGEPPERVESAHAHQQPAEA